MERRLPHTPAMGATSYAYADELEPACLGDSMPYDLLHDFISGPTYNRAVMAARAICGTCPLQQTCLRDNRHEVWAQAIIRGPKRYSKGEGRQGVAACGTDGGYYRHIRGTKDRPKTEPCAACRAAHAAKMAERAARQKAERKARERVTCPECGCLLKPDEACPRCELDNQRWLEIGAA